MEKHRKPMSARQLVDLARDEKLFSDRLAGKTLHQTMKSKLSVHVRRKGAESLFVRTAPGLFYLRQLLGKDEEPYHAPPLRPPNPREDVLVFKASWLDHFNNRFQGIIHSWEPLAEKILDNKICQYIERLQAEQNEGYKQVLTYIMVTRGSQILAFRRGTFNRVEDYLRGSHCIGFGGHVAGADRNIFNATGDLGILSNAARELSEELNLPPEDMKGLRSFKGLKIVGLLNDDSSPAGRRHFAFILRYEVVDSPRWDKPMRGEKSITQLRWLDLDASTVQLREFEYWSQLCLREYFPRFVDAQPSYVIRRKMPFRTPHLLCVLGTIGSGKSEATRMLSDEFGYTEINSGKVLAGILGIPPVPDTERSVFQAEAWRFISKPNGPFLFALEIWNQVRNQNSPRILIDGIRQRATLDQLKELAKGRRIALLYVHTPPDVTYEFYKGRSGPEFSIHDFIQVCDSPVEREVRGMIGFSDVVLYNWTGQLEYQNAIRSFMHEVDRKVLNP